ncbi:hypothetical protein KTC96_24370 (plasmid) [Clostridium estertheticum]|uniref:hypothetical protein n=1 Tax=Clostridium estertheticum TaxID=238834 RepID=UPI001C7DD6F2|nr:hypothetical protein [Clostridium estertheticum]MBX4262709.1 hypothetical protein [Clostridium estertheticum]WLC73120.1 hypothetical protein KTC96_24370 [Clostridium estertheticum]
MKTPEKSSIFLKQLAKGLISIGKIHANQDKRSTYNVGLFLHYKCFFIYCNLCMLYTIIGMDVFTMK